MALLIDIISLACLTIELSQSVVCFADCEAIILLWHSSIRMAIDSELQSSQPCSPALT